MDIFPSVPEASCQCSRTWSVSASCLCHYPATYVESVAAGQLAQGRRIVHDATSHLAWHCKVLLADTARRSVRGQHDRRVRQSRVVNLPNRYRLAWQVGSGVIGVVRIRTRRSLFGVGHVAHELAPQQVDIGQRLRLLPSSVPLWERHDAGYSQESLRTCQREPRREHSQ